MGIEKKIELIQRFLQKQGLDGWLLYDLHGSNRFIHDILNIPFDLMLTRRFFYWIPSKGVPLKILHKIEEKHLDQVMGRTMVYLSWSQLAEQLKETLKDAKKIVMEYSPFNSNPYVSVVDAGTIEMIREWGVDVGSSADLLQTCTSVLDEKQIATHKEAAEILENIVDSVWGFIAERVEQGQRISEYDVQEFIANEIKANDCVAEEGPICAVNAHSALPHYSARKDDAEEIRPGDFVLIDLWCKRNVDCAVYADITRVAVLASRPTPRQSEIFESVKWAQKEAINFMTSQIEEGKTISGFEVDDVCRACIRERGYGEFFNHRTGHNIDVHVHGAGAHLDNLETHDTRQLLPGMCFSIEPGIYLPNEFGVRLETNVLIGKESVEVTGGIQENIACLL